MDPLAKELLDHLRDSLAQAGLGQGGHLLIALSGGADSLCLVHLLWRLREPLGLALTAAHLDHGIRPSSAAEAEQVLALCRGWGMHGVTGRVDVPSLAQSWRCSLEVAARRERYHFLAAQARRHGCAAIALGHHADDQLETVLLRLLRGAGARGLRGMRPVSRLDPKFDETVRADERPLMLVRPLLGVTRASIEAYCERHHLTPIRDESNADASIPRNWLRHSVVPEVRERLPHVAASVGRAADVLAAEDDLLAKLANEAWQRCLRHFDAGRVAFGLEALRREHQALVRRLIRRAYAQATGSLTDLGWRHIRAVEQMIARGHVGKRIVLPHGVTAEMDYAALTIGRGGRPRERIWQPWLTAGDPLNFSWPGAVRPPGCDWRLAMRELPADGLPEGWDSSDDPYTAYLDVTRLPETLTLRARRPGDRLRPLGMRGSQSLQDLFVDRKVPRDQRDRVPLLVAGEDILWVVGYRVAADGAITAETDRVLHLRVVRDDGGSDARAGD